MAVNSRRQRTACQLRLIENGPDVSFPFCSQKKGNDTSGPFFILGLAVISKWTMICPNFLTSERESYEDIKAYWNGVRNLRLVAGHRSFCRRQHARRSKRNHSAR